LNSTPVQRDETLSGRLMGMLFGLIGRSLLGAALIVVLGAAGYLWFFQERLLMRPTVLPPSTVLAKAPDVSEVAVPVPGATLSALHLKRPGSKGLVFYLHGNAGSLATWFVNLDLYRNANLDLFMIDYRGYGKSSGQVQSEAQLRADSRAALLQVLPEYKGRKLVIVGRSLGTSLAAGLAAELSGDKLPGGQVPNLTVLISPYSSMVELAAEQYPLAPSFLLRYPLNTGALLGQVKGPVLMLHGTNDRLIPISHAERLRALVPTAELVPIPGAGHGDLQDYAIYLKRYVAALDAI
jgi:uncharacterized protein